MRKAGMTIDKEALLDKTNEDKSGNTIIFTGPPLHTDDRGVIFMESGEWKGVIIPGLGEQLEMLYGEEMIRSKIDNDKVKDKIIEQLIEHLLNLIEKLLTKFEEERLQVRGELEGKLLKVMEELEMLKTMSAELESLKKAIERDKE